MDKSKEYALGHIIKNAVKHMGGKGKKMRMSMMVIKEPNHEEIEEKEEIKEKMPLKEISGGMGHYTDNEIPYMRNGQMMDPDEYKKMYNMMKGRK